MIDSVAEYDDHWFGDVDSGQCQLSSVHASWLRHGHRWFDKQSHDGIFQSCEIVQQCWRSSIGDWTHGSIGNRCVLRRESEWFFSSLFQRSSSYVGKQNLSDDDHHRTECLLDHWWSPSDQRRGNPIDFLRNDRGESDGRLSSSIDFLHLHETHGPRFLSLCSGKWTRRHRDSLFVWLFSRRNSPMSIVWKLKTREYFFGWSMTGLRPSMFRPSYCFYLSSHRDRCSSLQARQFLVLFDNTDLSAQKIQRLILYLTYHIPQRNHFFFPSICRVRPSSHRYFSYLCECCNFSLLNVFRRWSARRSVSRRTVINTRICSISENVFFVCFKHRCF